MKGKRLGLLLPLLVAACVTVNIYFPASAVQKAADEIVDEIRVERGKKPETKPEIKKDEKTGQQSMQIHQTIATLLSPSEVYAEINVEISTPAIRALKEAMRGRFTYLQSFYSRGAIGENRDGYLEIRDTAMLNLKEKSDIMNLVNQENRDRQSLYNEIVKANRFGPETMPQVQRIFANSWRGKSQPGWWIQEDSGQWRQK